MFVRNDPVRLMFTEWSRLAGTSVGHPAQPPAQAGSPRAGCTGPCPGGAWVSPERRLHNLPGQPGPVLCHVPRWWVSHVLLCYVSKTWM